MKNEFKIREDLKTLLEEREESVLSLSNKIGVSLRTLNYILSGDKKTSWDTMDKIYSYSYKMGLRFNKIKAELFKEMNNNIVLFHGARDEIKAITSYGSRDNCDFGKGFYLGETYYQASSFVYDLNSSSVYSFSLDLKGLKILKFECDIEWMLAVCYYRGMINDYQDSRIIKNILKKIENMDVIVAPIADNKMFNIMREFGEGNITTLEAIHSLASSGLGNQYVLKSEKAISKLTEIERLFVSSEEKRSIDNMMVERANEIDTKLKITKREFRGKGQYIDELLK